MGTKARKVGRKSQTKARKSSGPVDPVDWSVPIGADELAARTRARRRYNRLRQDMATIRQAWLAHALYEERGASAKWGIYGWQREQARRFGVSESTISRDLRTIRAKGYAQRVVEVSLLVAEHTGKPPDIPYPAKLERMPRTREQDLARND